MKGKVTEIREMLAEIDKNYEDNPNSAKCVEEYSRKYTSLTEKDLNKPFTMGSAFDSATCILTL